LKSRVSDGDKSDPGCRLKVSGLTKLGLKPALDNPV
jgi:hypothetical protein